MCAERLRLFIAAEIPREVREALAEAMEPLRDRVPGARWVRPENLHVTLKFIGDYGEEGLEALSNEVLAVAGKCSPFRVRLGGCGAFPSPGRARVLWVGMEEGLEGAAAVAGKLDARLGKTGVKRENRGYRGHLTLARLKVPADCAAFLGELAENLGRGGTLSFGVERLVLYRSILGQSGPTYVALREYPLGGRSR